MLIKQEVIEGNTQEQNWIANEIMLEKREYRQACRYKNCSDNIHAYIAGNSAFDHRLLSLLVIPDIGRLEGGKA